MDATPEIEIAAITAAHIDGFHDALDAVARERKYLTMLEAPPLPRIREFVLDMIDKRNPQLVAVCDGQVVGWCDIRRDFFPSHAHRGTLGMGIISAYRGRGVGRRLISAALEKASQERFIRIELSVHADNMPAIALYEKAGFISEGLHKHAVCIDERFIDAITMAKILDTKRQPIS